MKEELERLESLNASIKLATTIIQSTTRVNTQLFKTMQSIRSSQDEQLEILYQWNDSLDKFSDYLDSL